MSKTRGFFYIFLITLLISGSAWGSWFLFHSYRILRASNPTYQIVAIVQTGPEREALKSEYLAELIGISVDKPTNLYQLNLHEAEKKLKSSPLIKQATIKRIPPGTLYIDYTIRKPVAFLGDFTNTALDEEGTMIPFTPFFTPKRLPELYLGNEGPTIVAWGTKLQGDSALIGLKYLMLIKNRCCTLDEQLISLDVSQIDASSYGQRQMIAVIEGKEKELTLLRLSTTNPSSELGHYLVLKKAIQPQTIMRVIDLRLPEIAMIENIQLEGIK